MNPWAEQQHRQEMTHWVSSVEFERVYRRVTEDDVPHHRVGKLIMLAAMAMGPLVANAQEVVSELPEVELKRIPPVHSYDVGLQLGAADITYWREETPPYMTLGGFFAWGWHPRGNARIGLGLAAIIEGPVPLYYSFSFEPTFRYDRISGKFAYGASVGGAAMVHGKDNQARANDIAFTPAPVAAVRFGWSEGWTRVGRRFFLVAEPKLRLIGGKPNPGFAIQIGSGAGY